MKNIIICSLLLFLPFCYVQASEVIVYAYKDFLAPSGIVYKTQYQGDNNLVFKQTFENSELASMYIREQRDSHNQMIKKSERVCFNTQIQIGKSAEVGGWTVTAYYPSTDKTLN